VIILYKTHIVMANVWTSLSQVLVPGASSPEPINCLLSLNILQNIESKWLPTLMGDQWKALQETIVAQASAPGAPLTNADASRAGASDLSETLRSLEKEIADSMTSAAAKRRAEIPSVLLKALEDATRSGAPAPTVARIWDLVVASRPVALDLMRIVKMAVREGVKCFEEVGLQGTLAG
jgi:hypothetical protein